MMGLVWIESERCWGKVIKYYADFCLVKYNKDGIEYEEIIEKDDLMDVKDLGIDYESE
jgi:hypothetical protein